MKRSFPFHPPLIAAFPVLSLFSTNQSLVPLPQLWRPLGVAIVGALVVWGLASAIARNWDRGASIASVLAIAFFGFDSIDRALRLSSLAVPLAVAIWAVLIVAPAYLLVRRPTAPTKGLNVLATMLAVIALGRAALGQVQTARPPEVATTAANPAAAGPRPDIFYIILDGYGREDSLKRAIGFDNAPFLAELRHRGFYVADRSHANYCQTELSIASSLNMEPIPKLFPNGFPNGLDRSPLASLISENAAVREARRQGYAVVTVGTGFPPVNLASADLHIEGERQGLTLVETALIQMTPLRYGELAGVSQFIVRQHRLNYAFSAMESLGERTSKPRFVLAHILAPHPPFVFLADGTPVRPKGGFGFWDGSDYNVYIGDDATYRKGYAGQVAYLNRRVLGILDRLLASPGPRPIIVIQGDHGSKVGLDQNSLANTDIAEVFPILNAYLVPDAVRKELYPDITPVNTFRILYSNLFGLSLPRLPDQSWYSGYAEPYTFTDVTARLP
ncbi:MAG: hypothetical protein ACO1SV_25920 [Fimbriimonas sp.]